MNEDNNPNNTNVNNPTEPVGNNNAPGLTPAFGTTEVKPDVPQATNEVSAAPAAEPAPTPSTGSTVSDSAASGPPVSSGGAHTKKGSSLPLIGLAVLAVGLLAGFLLNTALGHPLQNDDKTANTPQAQQVAEKKELQVPDGAVEINACAKGRGKQFALPKDIPFGPVYNVHEGKVTAVEFMPAQSDFTADTPKDFVDLKLYGVEYDHVDIGLLSKGHAGYPSPHYHIDVYTISYEESKKITCQ